ncbi:tetratricopeptide repeat protein 9C-like [Rhopilema esculentum]|uniref:tetratricopeptide repeat protein 9C-like n=1 Tax=Rhopilema esculentum TaxID=499914 RepID=UPI0031D6FDE2
MAEAEKPATTMEEKVEKALGLKSEGNEHFKNKDYKSAIRKYHNALLYVKGLLDRAKTYQSLGTALPEVTMQSPPSDELEEKIKELQLTCYNNLAACLLKTEKYDRVLDYSNKALGIESKNTKALFRRGTASYHLKNFHDAEKDFTYILELSPKETSVQKYLKEIELQKRNSLEKQKQMYSKMF